MALELHNDKPRYESELARSARIAKANADNGEEYRADERRVSALERRQTPGQEAQKGPEVELSPEEEGAIELAEKKLPRGTELHLELKGLTHPFRVVDLRLGTEGGRPEVYAVLLALDGTSRLASTPVNNILVSSEWEIEDRRVGHSEKKEEGQPGEYPKNSLESDLSAGPEKRRETIH